MAIANEDAVRGSLRRCARAAPRAVAVLAFSLLGACGPGEEPGADAPRLAFSVVDTERNSTVTAQRFVTLTDQAAWSALWAEHKSNHVPPPALPTLDFNRQMIAAVFLGERPNGCHAVSVESVLREPTRLVVVYRESAPAADAVCPAVMTAPAQIVAFERSDLSVEFVRAVVPLPTLVGVLGGEFSLIPGQRATIAGEDLSITFVSVTNDSRCPVPYPTDTVTVACVWEGNAEVNVTLVKAGYAPLTIRLDTARLAPHSAQGSYRDYTVRLLELTPPPRIASNLQQSDYTARLAVLR